ncbi:hypothetical protein FJU11_17930 [Pararhizobium mangrovi]|uniref:Extracellular solute-binding protein n=1 Tax=Pararhizobium mangrovi TaxID=2590452 RepID=A0A506TWU0_9HYPH|nr:hypothetical protein FJU11_17930 [Pararhizobium mangrovi]
MRKLYTTIALAGFTALTMTNSSTAQDAGTLTIASWGGIFRDTTKDFIAKPFEKETGAKVDIVDVGGGWAAKVEAQKASGSIQWDLIDSIDAGSAQYLFKNDMLAPLPDDLAKKLKEVSIDGTVTEYGIEEGSTGVVIACRTDIKCPTAAADFFRCQDVPGRSRDRQRAEPGTPLRGARCRHSRRQAFSGRSRQGFRSSRQDQERRFRLAEFRRPATTGVAFG